jgi:hypothetical protein
MGCDFYHVVLIGVKLQSQEELFNITTKTSYGCEHMEDTHKFCPECGRLSKREVSVVTPKISLEKDWRYCNFEKKPVINGKHFLFWDKEDREADVYIGIYKEICHTSDPATFMTVSEINKFLPKLEELLEFLSSHNIKIKEESAGVYTIPLVSC